MNNIVIIFCLVFIAFGGIGFFILYRRHGFSFKRLIKYSTKIGQPYGLAECTCVSSALANYSYENGDFINAQILRNQIYLASRMVYNLPNGDLDTLINDTSNLINDLNDKDEFANRVPVRILSNQIYLIELLDYYEKPVIRDFGCVPKSPTIPALDRFVSILRKLVYIIVALIFVGYFIYNEAQAQTAIDPAKLGFDNQQQQLHNNTHPSQVVGNNPANVIGQRNTDQLNQQIQGLFPTPAFDANLSGGQIQESWFGQGAHGVKHYNYCPQCTYKVRLREHMVTGIALPDNEVIMSAKLGNEGSFFVEVPNAKHVADGNIINVKPKYWGVDTSLIVYTKSGRVYAFYLWAENINSKHIPHIFVKINGDVNQDGIKTIEGHASIANKNNNDTSTPSLSDLIPPNLAQLNDMNRQKQSLQKQSLKDKKVNGGKDFVKNVPIDPAKFHGFNDYKLWGDDKLAPVVVFRDEHFTYLKYGKKWTGFTNIPIVGIVENGVDTLVNTRVDGDTYIIESTAELISLVIGNRVLCIQYMGEGL